MFYHSNTKVTSTFPFSLPEPSRTFKPRDVVMHNSNSKLGRYRQAEGLEVQEQQALFSPWGTYRA
ncbi:hypothetical protein ACQP3D_29780, partial [Escherichia coli]